MQQGIEPSVRARTLREIADAVTRGDKTLPDVPVTGITFDSRQVEPGNVFVAVAGYEIDGHAFVDDAVRSGACAIVAERDVEVRDVALIRVPDARTALGRLAAAWYGHPAERLPMLGITGTLGKTTVLSMIEMILNGAGMPCGVIGSEIIGIRLEGAFADKTGHTTPDPLTLQEGLSKFVDHGARYAAMEVTSHALDQSRVQGLSYATGVFTNLVPDEHQDYHGSFEAYVEAKSLFFDHLEDGAPLVYEAGHEALDLLLRTDPRARKLQFVGCGGAGPQVIVHPRATTRTGTRFDLEVPEGLPRMRGGERLPPMTMRLEMPLLGMPHLRNAVLASVAAMTMGADPDDIRSGLRTLRPPSRRMELRIHPRGLLVLDDTAYHPESFLAAFDVAAGLPFSDLHVVVAIRGQRGVDINHKDAEALDECCRRLGASTVVVTSSGDILDEGDLPTQDECAAFMSGIHGNAQYTEALSEAIDVVQGRASEGDLVMLLGARGMREGARLLGCLESDVPAR
jgi:UDP-N-acetylmuramoyl-L-alanyl-D-glutamate--2,6-diaminopimelate ligase